MNKIEAIQFNDIGIAVNKIQGYLNILQKNGVIHRKLREDGMFGNDTKNVVMEFQSVFQLKVNGIIDDITWNVLVEEAHKIETNIQIPVASSMYFLQLGMQGLAIRQLQMYMKYGIDDTSMNVNGIFDEKSKQVLLRLQQQWGLELDGCMKANDWDAIVFYYFQRKSF